MNDIGWLFLFMSDFEDNSVQTTGPAQPEQSGYSEICAKPFASLTDEQIEAVREFFELIAKWDERNSNHGN